MKDPNKKSRRPARSDSGTARSKLIPGRELNQAEPGTDRLRARWAAWYANTGPVWKFALNFGALMVLFYGLILTPVFDRLLYSYLVANARLANVILNWLGQATQVSDVTIRSAHFAIAVRRGCDAVEPSWFFCAALLAFPASWSRKALGMLVGVVLLQVLNLLRIVSLYLVGLSYPRLFNTAHVEIWPATFILVAVALWIGWIGLSRRSPPATPHATP